MNPAEGYHGMICNVSQCIQDLISSSGKPHVEDTEKNTDRHDKSVVYFVNVFTYIYIYIHMCIIDMSHFEGGKSTPG